MTTPLSDSPNGWQQSTIRRFLKRQFSWRTARWALIDFAVLATVVALFYAEENFRGKRPWDAYRRELEVRGEQLDWRAFIPKPVPDNQNFAATPVIQSWFVRSNYTYHASEYWKNDNYGRVSDRISNSQYKKDEGNRHFTDLVAWEMAFDAVRSGKFSRSQRFESSQVDRESRAKAVPAVLDGLMTNAAIFAELRAASHRPYSRYPVNYDVEDPAEVLLPHLNSMRAVCRRLGLRASAELAAGRSEEALEDVEFTLHMGDSLRNEPTLISYLVRIACLHLTTQPIWEGLAESGWSDEQLRELQTLLQQHNFVADLKEALDVERAFGVGIIEFIRNTGKLAELSDVGDGGSPLDRFVRFAPNGWYDLEQVNYCRLFELQMAGTFDPAAKRVSPSQIKSNEQALDRVFHDQNPLAAIFIRHQVLSAMLLPALPRIPVKAATAQIAADQAALGCALERYRLANGQFPEKLDALVPRFIAQLPHDVITGEPYKYHLTKDGRFILYSVGWNEKDDGGVSGKTLFAEKDGDWVWQYPARQEPTLFTSAWPEAVPRPPASPDRGRACRHRDGDGRCNTANLSRYRCPDRYP